MNDIIPTVPFVPEPAPAEIVRRIVEWPDRGDLSATLYNGEWHCIHDLGCYGVKIRLLERWVPMPDDPNHIWWEHSLQRYD
jgi:hypothetical protein